MTHNSVLQSFGGDSRFNLDSRFKGDLDMAALRDRPSLQHIAETLRDTDILPERGVSDDSDDDGADGGSGDGEDDDEAKTRVTKKEKLAALSVLDSVLG